MLVPSAYLASAASILLLQQSILPDSILALRIIIIFGCKAISRLRLVRHYGVWADLANSPKPSPQTQHTQKAWDGPVAANQKNLILSRAPSDVDKARLLAVASPHSGDWLHTPPITAVGLRLPDEAIRVAVAHRLGSKACEPHTCMVRQWMHWAA